MKQVPHTITELYFCMNKKIFDKGDKTELETGTLVVIGHSTVSTELDWLDSTVLCNISSVKMLGLVLSCQVLRTQSPAKQTVM